MNPKTVAIIGAGPVGLAAAAHVLECSTGRLIWDWRGGAVRQRTCDGAALRCFEEEGDDEKAISFEFLS